MSKSATKKTKTSKVTQSKAAESSSKPAKAKSDGKLSCIDAAANVLDGGKVPPILTAGKNRPFAGLSCHFNGEEVPRTDFESGVVLGSMHRPSVFANGPIKESHGAYGEKVAGRWMRCTFWANSIRHGSTPVGADNFGPAVTDS